MYFFSVAKLSRQPLTGVYTRKEEIIINYTAGVNCQKCIRLNGDQNFRPKAEKTSFFLYDAKTVQTLIKCG